MPIDIPVLAAQLGTSILASLKNQGDAVRAQALAEAETLAHSLARIAGLLASGQIDPDEATALTGVQADASGAVLASLGEISRRAARKAVGGALVDAVRLLVSAAGIVPPAPPR